MKNLKVWQKLALMGIVFMIPFAVVSYAMVTSINTLGADVARRESRGLEYLAPVLALVKDLQLHRSAAGAVLAGDAASSEPLAARRDDVQKDLRAIAAVDAQSALLPSARWSALKAGCGALIGDVAGLAADDSFHRHTKLIADALALLVDVGDVSRLTLDPDPDSRYLVDAAVVQGPALAEALAQARDLGVRLAPGKGASAELSAQLLERAQRAEYLAQQVSTSLTKATGFNPSLQPQLLKPAQAASAAVRASVALVRRLASGHADAEFAATTADGVDAVLAVAAHARVALGELLARRTGQLQMQMRTSLGSAGLGLLLAILLGLLLLLDITRPLRRVVTIANEIADGDLSVNVAPEVRRDEMGELAKAFDHMVAFLREMVHVAEQIAEGNLAVEVKPQSDRDLIGGSLASMVASLSALVGQVQKSGIQVASSVNQIAATSKQQQATATEIAATTMQIGATSKEISATSRELLHTVGEVSRVAEQSAALAGTGHAGLTHMEESMHNVVEAASSINSKLAVLNEKAGNISQVITTISKVADQTNLLSLNAAIEAEKAGEYGRGFSVVATEIRRLADQTAVATYDIEQMVKEIQSAVAAGVMGMDKFSEEVRRGMQDIQHVGTQLAQIIQQVQTLAPRFEAVNEGMQAQATGAEQITQALAGLNEAAQQTVESLRQSSQAIDGLNEVSGGLRSGISRFRLAQ